MHKSKFQNPTYRFNPQGNAKLPSVWLVTTVWAGLVLRHHLESVSQDTLTHEILLRPPRLATYRAASAAFTSFKV